MTSIPSGTNLTPEAKVGQDDVWVIVGPGRRVLNARAVENRRGPVCVLEQNHQRAGASFTASRPPVARRA